MEYINPMDILNAPTSEESTVAKIFQWVKSAKDDNNKVTTFTFKKNTPKSILDLFQRNTDLFLYKVNKNYKVEK